MGSYIAKTPFEMENDFETEEEDLELKLTVLRDALIHLRVQFLHFQSFYKEWNSHNERVENDLKALKIILMVVQNRIEELKSIVSEYTELKNMSSMKRKIEDFDLIVTQIILEMKEFERDNFLIEKMEKLINQLNPFDVPNMKTIESENDEFQMNPNDVIKTIIGKEALLKQEKERKEQIQNEEENEIRHDNTKILNGQRKIYKILRKPVVVLVNYLEDECTLKTLQILNENQVDYNIFDVSTDSEIRLIVKYLSDCETFPQLFVKGNFEKLSGINSLIKSLPKLYVN
uniref:Glutaredoxin domain-containing protein n=1 Tax=Caenorhabditis tropicalis TaxID=1561998 RepID=A0A1I7UW12_9PELO